MINQKDVEILHVIQNNAKASNPVIGKAVGLTPSAVFERIRKLEAKGIIQSYHTRLDPRAVGLGVLAFVFLTVEIHATGAEVDGLLEAIEEVQEVHHVSGEDCYLLKVRAADNDDLGRLLIEKIHTIPGVRSTRTNIVLKTVKESPGIPLTRDAGGGEA
jgi:Lrp/AsnC family leucine-responsive transcriptional regulator